MKNNFKRCLALLLALMTIVGAFSIPVSAAEECDHDWKVYGEIVKPTCTAQGYTTEFCAKCQEYRITDVKSKLPHEHVPATKEALPTCSKWGYFVGALVCPLCGDIDDTNWTQEQKDKYKPVDTLPTTEAELKKDKYHKWGDPEVIGEACVGQEYKLKYTCSECKKSVTFDKTSTTGKHDYEYTNRVNPTCLTEGSVVRTCKECGEKTTLKIEKSAHTFDGKNVKYDFVKVDNDAKAQHQSYENCVVCGAKGNQGAKSNHNWDETKTVTVASTCAALGKETKTCKECGYVKDFEFKVQPNHTYNAAIVVSRVEAKHNTAIRTHAYTEHNCTTCGNNFKLYDGWNETDGGNGNMRWVPKNLNDHDWTKASEVSSTCFVAGATRYTCTCGAEKNVAIAAAHVWVKDPADTSKDLVTTVKPTCSDKGYDYKTCQYCGEIEKSNPKDPLKSDGTHKTTTEDITKEGYVKATCLYDGKIPLWCSDCNAVAGYKTVAKINTSSHKASQAKVTYEGSGCFDNRYKVTTCQKGCMTTDGSAKAFVKELVIERQGSHNYVKDVVVKEATCYSVGINGKECDRCKAAGIDSVIETEFTSFSEKHTGIQVYSVNAETYWNDPAGPALNISNPHPNYATTGEVWKAVDFTKYSCDEPIYEWWYCNACHRNYRAPMKAQVETVTKTGSFYIESTKKYVTEVTLNPVSGSHTFYIEVKKAASCFATGEATKKCAMCNLSETITLPKIPHAILKHPTQTDKDGKPVDLKIEVSAAFDNLGTVTGATCTSAYNWKKWCETCHSYVEFGTDAALGHDWPTKYEVVVTPNTCVATGVNKRVCKRGCGAEETIVTAATGVHSGSKIAGEAATCTKDGVKDTFKCSVCEQLFEQVKDKDGNVTSTPVVKKPAVIPALGHQTYENAIKSYKKNNVTAQHDLYTGTPVAPTCTSVGYTPILCKTCKKVEIGQTDYKPMTAHNYIFANNDGKIDETDYDPANVVEPTCQDYWYKYIACSTCTGHFYKITDDSKPKKPHVNAAGDVLTGSCLLELDDYNCVNGTTAHKVEPKHNYTEEHKSSACHGTSHYCGVCEKWFFTVEKNKKATHTYPTDTADYIEYKAPTMTTKGYEKKACIVCKYVTEGELDKLPAVTFSLEAVNANDAAAVIVNGGKIYVNIKMDAQDVSVNGIKLSIKYDPAVLTLLKSESEAIPSVFGAVTGGSKQPAVNAVNGIVTIYDEAGSIRDNVAIGDADLFATLVFQVNPTAYTKKDYKKTSIEFYTGYDVKDNPYKSQVTTKTAEGYADNNFAYGDKIEVKIKQLGDYNNDGLVDSKDVSAVADLAVLNFTEKKYDAVLDIDHNGEVDLIDYKYIKLFQVPGSYKSEAEFYDVAIYEARLAEEAKKAEEANK